MSSRGRGWGWRRRRWGCRGTVIGEAQLREPLPSAWGGPGAAPKGLRGPCGAMSAGISTVSGSLHVARVGDRNCAGSRPLARSCFRPDLASAPGGGPRPGKPPRSPSS